MKNSLWRTVDEENFLEVDRNDRIFVSTKLSKKSCDKSNDAPRTPEASCDQETTASVPFVDVL